MKVSEEISWLPDNENNCGTDKKPLQIDLNCMYEYYLVWSVILKPKCIIHPGILGYSDFWDFLKASHELYENKNVLVYQLEG